MGYNDKWKRKNAKPGRKQTIQRRPGPSPELRKAARTARAGIDHISAVASDELIRPGYGDDGVLVAAVEAQHQVLFALLVQGHGLRNTRKSREDMAKHQVVLLRLLHSAYACGIRRGLGGGQAAGSDNGGGSGAASAWEGPSGDLAPGGGG